ncbi:hypothetical protein AY599_17885 [Leptolyngbya valderiana BDU 20041]|nr:hypothetical protein AY599_17885 [Leptolyngbya valderiana BDU 20041]
MARLHRTSMGISAALLALVVLVSLAFAQDDPPEAPPADRGQADPGRLSALVERRLDQAERQQERLREIKRRLDAGESPAAILAELRERGELGVLGEWGRGSDRDGPRRFRDGDDSRDPQDLPPEAYELWRTRILDFFDRHAPEMAERLRAEGENEESRRAVLRLRREVERLIELREQGSDEFEPALARLRNGIRIADLLGEVRAEAQAGTLSPEKLRTMRRDLTELVGTQFDAQLTARAKWLDRMGDRLRGAREKLERERAERSQRIEAEVQAMLDRAMKPGEDRRDGVPRPGGPRNGPR